MFHFGIYRHSARAHPNDWEKSSTTIEHCKFPWLVIINLPDSQITSRRQYVRKDILFECWERKDERGKRKWKKKRQINAIAAVNPEWAIFNCWTKWKSFKYSFSRNVRIHGSRHETNLEPGPSALRWLLGDDPADWAWGRVKITSQLIGYFEGKAVLPRIYFRTAGGHRAVAKLSLGRAGLKFESFRQTVASCEHVATRLAGASQAQLLQFVLCNDSNMREESTRSMGLVAKALK